MKARVRSPEALRLPIHRARPLDGAEPLSPGRFFGLLESRLKPGALIVADNADMSPDYLKRVRSLASGYMSVPFGEDVELSMRIG